MNIVVVLNSSEPRLTPSGRGTPKLSSTLSPSSSMVSSAASNVIDLYLSSGSKVTLMGPT